MHRAPNQGYGPFEAFSIKPNGEFLHTFHRSASQAQKRLANNPRHTGHNLVDHRPIDEKGQRQWIWLKSPSTVSVNIIYAPFTVAAAADKRSMAADEMRAFLEVERHIPGSLIRKLKSRFKISGGKK